MLTGIGQDTVRELRAGRPPGVTEDAPCAVPGMPGHGEGERCVGGPWLPGLPPSPFPLTYLGRSGVTCSQAMACWPCAEQLWGS